MSPRSPQLAWPLSLIGATVGAQLPAPLTSGVILALVLGLFGALVSGALERVRDWQVALMSPLTGAVTGATLGWSISSFDGAAIGFVAGIGFGLCALPPLVLITSAARRASRLPPSSFLGRAQRRRVWLVALSMSTLAQLVLPALARPWSHPSESPLTQGCATAFMVLALIDAALWIAAAHQGPGANADARMAPNPYRENAAPAPTCDLRLMGVLAAESLLYDALLVAIVASALLVSR